MFWKGTYSRILSLNERLTNENQVKQQYIFNLHGPLDPLNGPLVKNP